MFSPFYIRLELLVIIFSWILKHIFLSDYKIWDHNTNINFKKK